MCELWQEALVSEEPPLHFWQNLDIEDTRFSPRDWLTFVVISPGEGEDRCAGAPIQVASCNGAIFASGDGGPEEYDLVGCWVFWAKGYDGGGGWLVAERDEMLMKNVVF